MASSLVFKPLRIVEPTFIRGAEMAPVEKIGDEHLLLLHWVKSSPGDEACDNFTLADVVIGETVLGGTTTRGFFEFGVVTGYTKGWCFSFDGVNQGSMMWRNFLLVRGPLADAARARYKAYTNYSSDGDSPAPPMKRTDSGSNYGFSGCPDVDFWVRSGVQPWYVVTAWDYNGYNETPEQLSARIADTERLFADKGLTVNQRAALEYQLGVLKAKLGGGSG